MRRGLFSYMNVENFFWEAGVFGCANGGEIGSLHSNLTKMFGIFDDFSNCTFFLSETLCKVEHVNC